MNAPQRRLVLPLLLAAATLLLWGTPVVYPFRLFVVFLHEISHGIAAVVTGGQIVSIGMSEAGGVCFTRGGWRLLILNAGYLGSLLWGALFLVLGARRTRARSVIAVVGLFTLLITLAYVRTWFGFLYGVSAGAALVAIAAKLRPVVSETLLAAIGATSVLYTVWDVVADVLVVHSGQSDASALARLTLVPAIVWGAAWIAISAVVLVQVIRRLA
jgi:hypothetical protein